MIGRASVGFIALSVLLAANTAVAQSIQVGVPPATWWSAAITFGMITSAGAVAVALLPPVMRFYRPSVPKPNLTEEIPFLRIDNDGQTVLCEDGIKFRVLELEGVNYASIDRAQIEEYFKARRYLLKQLDQIGGIQLIIFSERAKMRVRLAEGGTNEWLAEVNQVWADGFEQSYVNRHSVIVIDLNSGNLDDACDAVRNNLNDFGVSTLTHSNEGPSPLWAFLYRYVKGLGGPGWHGPGEDLPAELADGAMFFDPSNGMIESTDGERRRFWKIVTADHLGEEADAGLMRRMGNINREVIAVHRIVLKGLSDSSSMIRKKKANNFMFWANERQKAEFDEAEDALFAGDEGYADYELSFSVYGDTPEEAHDAAAEVKSMLTQFRGRGVTETTFVEDAHWDRFPHKRPLWLRAHMPRLSDVAEMLSFEGTPRGLLKCWWGPSPLRTMRTAASVPYGVGVHEHEREEALGNAAFIGKPGSGKTTLAAWLITGALSQFSNMRVFCFDNLDGLSVPTIAFGGTVVRPGTPGDKTFSLAPLQMDNTRENREFLGPFLLGLAGVDIDAPRHLKVINEALDMIMVQPKRDRTLTELVHNCVAHDTEVFIGLESWIDHGTLSGWFDGESDSVDLDASRWITFDMQRVIENPRLASSLVLYISHRIRTTIWATPTPHIIFVDEAATMAAANTQFVTLFSYLARNIRKKMGVVWFAFQDPGGMGEMNEVVRNTTATNFFWRDPSTTNADYDGFNLTEADMRFIRDDDDQLRHLRRGVLAVRKLEAGRESVVIDGNLAGLGKYLQLYRSGSDAADTLAKNRAKYGDDKCIGPYLADMSAPSS